MVFHAALSRLDIAYRDFQVVEILLQFGVLLGHILVFALPLVTGCLQSLYLAFVVTGLDVGLAESRGGNIVSKLTSEELRSILLICLPQVLIGLFGFLLQQL